MFGGAILVGIGLSPTYVLAAAILATGGIAGGSFMKLNQTLTQSNEHPHPGDSRCPPLNALVAGVFAGIIGSKPWMVVGGLAVMIAGVLMLLSNGNCGLMD